ncbi:putative oxidoreductase [Dioscorea sansibarensis]
MGIMKAMALEAIMLMVIIGGAAATTKSPSVIIVGAGMSGISAAKTLSDAGITDLTILESTGRIGGRMYRVPFAGLQVEKGANWVEGVGGKELNPIWKMAQELHLRNFNSDYDNISANCYKENGGLYEEKVVNDALEIVAKTEKSAEKLSSSLPSSGFEDISLLTMQRLMKHVPTDPVSMVTDYYTYDYEFAEPPRVTSMQNTVPLPTFANFGDKLHFVADQRGYESLVYHLAHQFLKSDNHGNFVDPRLIFNQVVRRISYSAKEATVTTEDGKVYKADYVMVSVSIGVLQTNLIKFVPPLPDRKIIAMYQFDMSVYTKIFLKFNSTFWPTGDGTEFFLYASERRGYYPIWQHLEKEFPGSHVLLVTVTDEESRRIEQQSENDTKKEVMEVLRKLFGTNIPDATDILVPKWWSDRFYKGSFSNWPIGVNRYEFDQMKAPIGRVYFTGEHTSEHYNGYVHGAYLAGIDSANIMIRCIKNGFCKFSVKAKNA